MLSALILISFSAEYAEFIGILIWEADAESIKAAAIGSSFLGLTPCIDLTS